MKKIYSNIFFSCIAMLGAFAMSAQMVTVEINGGGFAGEVGWIIADDAGTVSACEAGVPAGFSSRPFNVTGGVNLNVYAYDSFGDGWNGADITILDAGVVVLGPSTMATQGGTAANCGTGNVAAGELLGSFMVAPLACTITAPADITVNADQSVMIGDVTCAANVVLPLAELGADCPIEVVDCSTTVESVFTAFNTDATGDLLDSPFDVAVGLTMITDPAITVVPVEFLINGDHGAAVEAVDITDESGVIILNYNGSAVGDCGESTVTYDMPVADYNTFAADGVLTFTMLENQTVDVPFCASSSVTTTVCQPVVIPADDAIVNDFNMNGADASDLYPFGVNVVVFSFTSDLGTVTDTTIITVLDLEAPITDCPSDLTISLDPGQCDIAYFFDASATDNCGLLGEQEVDGSGPFGTLEGCAGNDGFSVACNAGNTTVTQELDVSSIVVASEITAGCFIFDNAAWGLTEANVRLYQGTDITAENLIAGGIPVAEGNAVIAANSGDAVCVTFDVPFIYDPAVATGSLFLEVDGVGVGELAFMGPECNGVIADGTNTYLNSDACGAGFLADFGFTNDIFVGFEATPLSVGVPDADNPGEAGVRLPIGDHEFSFDFEDLAGNISTCSWIVTVEEFPLELQTTSLACNDQVNISVDDACAVTFSADQFLEGGPYGCYEGYQIEIFPFGSGPAIPVAEGEAVDFSGLLGTHEYRVFDNTNPDNFCWGYFTIEDKLAPSLVCEDITINCDDSTEPNGAIAGGVVSMAGGIGETITQGTDVVTTFEAIGGAVESVTVDLDINHTWIGDLVITLESPDGTEATLFNGNCGNTDDLIASFADGADAFDCGANAAGNTYAPETPFADFNGGMAAGTWTLTIADVFGGDDGILNAVSLNLTAGNASLPGAEVTDNCSDATPQFTDVIVDGECTDPYFQQIIRTWTAVDASGNEAAPCTQTISIRRQGIADVVGDLINFDGLPGNNPSIECDAVVLDANEPFHANGDPNLDANTYGVASADAVCGSIVTYYEDVVIPLCDQTCSFTNNSYKVVRTFTILDWCTGEIINPTQILKVEDNTAPDLSAIADMTVSTDIWGCGATINLPVAAATDNCTATEDITFTFSSSAGTQVGNSFVLADPAKTMPGAPVVITVTASDCCGNSSSTTFDVTVVDAVPPVVVAETSRTVALSTDGVAKAFAEDFDDGSHDGCGPIEFFVRRADGGGACAPISEFGLYPGSDNGHEVAANNTDDNDEFNDIVHFCCADVGNVVIVEFRVCDDANMDGIVGNNGDNCNMGWVEVEVQDKLAPAIICPPDMVISCVDLAGLGNLQDLSDAFLDANFGAATAAATCNVTVDQTIVGSSACGAGTVIRNFTATNSIGQTSTCSQFITVTADVTNTLTCDRINFASLNNNVYDWCDVNDNTNDNDDDLPAITVDCTDGLEIPELDIDINGLCTEVGLSVEVDTFNFAGGACRKYIVHYEVIDQCVFEENFVDPVTGELDPFNSLNGYFEFFIEIDAFDNEEPTLDCAPVEVVSQSCTGYDGSISITGSDNCTDPSFFGYQWRLDVGADNTIDTDWVQSATVTPGATGLGITEFPIGNHTIFWQVSDGCGNNATCSQPVTILGNDKAPTPYCIDGLATAVMPSTGTVAIWAVDFDQGSFDNCDGPLNITMIPEVDSDGLSIEEAFAASTPGWDFDCTYIPNGVSAIIEVRIYVEDADGNFDFCTASLRIDDNFDACPDAGSLTYEVDGTLKTQLGEGVEEVDVTVDASFPEFPMTETVDEAYAFDLIENVDYLITPEKNDDHLNGITTADIVLIQKHILGLQPITSPYTLIAADVNNDCKVNGTDIIQIRKLLLGKYNNDEFPNNTSWRFVESDFAFPNPLAPCDFNEETDIFNLSSDQSHDYIAAKIGDINQSAEANFTSEAEVRSNETIEFVVVDQAVEAGSTVKVPFLAKDFAQVYGFQYTMNLAGANFVSVESGALNVNENNFGLRRDGIVVSVDLAQGSTLADDAILFTVTLEATTASNLSEIININSTAIAAEAYVGGNLEILGSDVVFRTNEGVIADAEFALYQNEPNPFNGVTAIGFELPTSGEATLTVYDVTGKVLFNKVDTYAKGYNVVTINRSNIQAAGVLYYKLENGDNVATKKMIIIE